MEATVTRRYPQQQQQNLEMQNYQIRQPSQVATIGPGGAAVNAPQLASALAVANGGVSVTTNGAVIDVANGGANPTVHNSNNTGNKTNNNPNTAATVGNTLVVVDPENAALTEAQQQQQQQQQQQSQQQLDPLSEATAETWLSIASLAEAIGDMDRMAMAYDATLQFNPASTTALAALANLYRSRDMFQKAAELYERALAINPELSDVWTTLGHCYLMLDDLQRAYNAYQQALYHLSDPNVPKLWHGIGILYDRYGSLDYAEEAFAKVLELDPHFEKANEIYFRLGIIYKHQGKWNQALECFRYIIAQPPAPLQEWDIWFQLGSVLESMNEWQGAREAYEHVLLQNEHHAKVLHQLGCLYGMNNVQFYDPQKALNYLLRSLEVDPSDATTWYHLGRVHMIRSDYTAAYDAFQQAVNRDSKNPIFWCSIGVLYYQISQYRDALDAYTRAIRLNPYISEVWYDLGTLYETCNNQLTDALDAYKQAARLDPENALIRKRLEALTQQLANPQATNVIQTQSQQQYQMSPGAPNGPIAGNLISNGSAVGQQMPLMLQPTLQTNDQSNPLNMVPQTAVAAPAVAAAVSVGQQPVTQQAPPPVAMYSGAQLDHVQQPQIPPQHQVQSQPQVQVQAQPLPPAASAQQQQQQQQTPSRLQVYDSAARSRQPQQQTQLQQIVSPAQPRIQQQQPQPVEVSRSQVSTIATPQPQQVNATQYVTAAGVQSNLAQDPSPKGPSIDRSSATAQKQQATVTARSFPATTQGSAEIETAQVSKLNMPVSSVQVPPAPIPNSAARVTQPTTVLPQKRPNENNINTLVDAAVSDANNNVIPERGFTQQVPTTTTVSDSPDPGVKKRKTESPVKIDAPKQPLTSPRPYDPTQTSPTQERRPSPSLEVRSQGEARSINVNGSTNPPVSSSSVSTPVFAPVNAPAVTSTTSPSVNVRTTVEHIAASEPHSAGVSGHATASVSQVTQSNGSGVATPGFYVAAGCEGTPTVATPSPMPIVDGVTKPSTAVPTTVPVPAAAPTPTPTSTQVTAVVAETSPAGQSQPREEETVIKPTADTMERIQEEAKLREEEERERSGLATSAKKSPTLAASPVLGSGSSRSPSTANGSGSQIGATTRENAVRQVEEDENYDE